MTQIAYFERSLAICEGLGAKARADIVRDNKEH